jgi:hypothetical protein
MHLIDCFNQLHDSFKPFVVYLIVLLLLNSCGGQTNNASIIVSNNSKYSIWENKLVSQLHDQNTIFAHDEEYNTDEPSF